MILLLDFTKITQRGLCTTQNGPFWLAFRSSNLDGLATDKALPVRKLALNFFVNSLLYLIK